MGVGYYEYSNLLENKLDWVFSRIEYFTHHLGRCKKHEDKTRLVLLTLVYMDRYRLIIEEIKKTNILMIQCLLDSLPNSYDDSGFQQKLLN